MPLDCWYRYHTLEEPVNNFSVGLAESHVPISAAANCKREKDGVAIILSLRGVSGFHGGYQKQRVCKVVVHELDRGYSSRRIAALCLHWR